MKINKNEDFNWNAFRISNGKHEMFKQTDKVGRLNYAMPAFSVQKPYGQAGRGKTNLLFSYFTNIKRTYERRKAARMMHHPLLELARVEACVVLLTVPVLRYDSARHHA
ncbi:Sensor histidine kinase WalK [Trichinella spiralis]|uniref:Sensor histidine kinase WalK n=1 Tax=Trichinella spiralis TaxID=6334 RepID=A0ABR3L4M2_TRISP